jgi:excinuclease ABC subunit A
MYERQSTNEGPEAPVDSISGLGVTAVTKAGGQYYSWRIDPRYTIGNAAGLLNNLFSIVATLGAMECKNCGTVMINTKKGWSCPECNNQLGIITPEMLSPMNLATCCPKCKGLGFFGKPNPDKLIIHPDKPICGGAMYSPGFWPFGYYCKKYNHPYYTLRAMAKHFGYDCEKTPWNEMSEEAQQAFLFGCDIIFEHEYETRSVKKSIRKSKWSGPFHEWGGFSWWSFGDLFETYSDKFTCPDCKGQRLRSEYLSLRLKGKNIHELRQMTLQNLLKLLKKIKESDFSEFPLKKQYWERITKRLENIQRVGLGYLNIDRPTYTLSAGEYERLRIASTLGSGLTSITLLLDEPSRGLHASEVNNLSLVLKELCEEGNTVIVVEHDEEIIKKADHIIDMGPGAGILGGEVIAEGNLGEILQTNTITAQWLSGKRKTNSTNNPKRLQPKKWMIIKGARENNLKNIDVQIPLGLLVGVAGVSGSGKSSLIIDTLGIALSSKRHTTSLASEQIRPGDHDSIEGAPKKVLLVDQSKKRIYSPMRYFGLYNKFVKIYADSEDADFLGITEVMFKKRCTACKGRGRTQMDMGFLPTTFSECDICKGTGYAPELWDVKVNGYSLPELGRVTIEEVYALFKDKSDYIARYLKAAIDVGLGYLVLQQPGYTLSGGEAQRMKIANELCKKTKSSTLYILDEPSYGQHLEDVERLIGILKRMVKEGNSVIVVEHHPNILAACDWLIELGPVGGPEGGEVIASGTPETIIEKNTPTSLYLKTILEGSL